METYDYQNRVWQIHINEQGKRFDWFITDDNGSYHRNSGEWAPTRGVAIDEAKDKIHRLARESP